MTFRFAGPITMQNARASLAACVAAIDRGETDLALDALATSALGHSDSAAVAVLVAARRHAGLTGRTLRLSGVPPAVDSLAKLYGVEEYVG